MTGHPEPRAPSARSSPSSEARPLPASTFAIKRKPPTPDDSDSIPSTFSSAAPSATSGSSAGTSMTSYRSNASISSASGMSSSTGSGSVAGHLDSFPLPAHRDTAAIRRSMDQGAIAEGVAYEHEQHMANAFPLTSSSSQISSTRAFAPRPPRSRETSHDSRASESTLESCGTSHDGSASASSSRGGPHSPPTTHAVLASNAVYQPGPSSSSRQRERPSGGASAATSASSHPPNAWASRSSASSLSLAGRNRSSSVGSSEFRSSPSESSPRTSSLLSSSSGVAEPVSSSSEAGSLSRRPRAATWKASVPSNLQLDESDDQSPVPATGFSVSSLPGGRTPRSSMYGAFEPLSAAAEPLSSASSSSGTAASGGATSGQRPPSPSQRRRIFSRKGSILGGSKESLAGSATGSASSEPGGGATRTFMRRVGSRSFFGSNSRDKEGLALQEAMRSTDSLASAAGSVRTESSVTSGSQSRSSDLLARTKTLPKWARRKISLRSGDGGQAAAAAATAAVAKANARLEHRQSTSSSSTTAGSDLVRVDDASSSAGQDGEAVPGTPVGTLSASSGADRAASAGATSADANEGIPRRLSGWIFNMLGSEGSQVDLSRQPGLSTTSEAASLRPLDASVAGSRSASASATPGGTPLPASASAASSSSHQHHQQQMQRPKTSGGGGSGLLQSLSSSARARAMAAAGAMSGGGGGGGGGLDRALRYFLDDSSTAAGEDEGIWLLGVWHGPEQSKPASPQSKDSQLSPPSSPQASARKGPSIAISQPSPEAPRRMPFPSSSPSASPRAARSSEDFARRRMRETSPALSDATSAESGGLHSGGDSLPSSRQASEPPRTPSPSEAGPISEASTPSDAVLVRNPPTPNAEASAAFVSKTANRRAASATSPSTPSAVLSGMALPSFQSDFGSKVWCTYRSHFVPIARDGTISEQAENAALRAAQIQTPSPSTPATPMAERTPAQSNVNTPGTGAAATTPSGGRTGWLGRRLGDGSNSTGDLLNTSASGGQMAASPTLSGSLGAAMGLSSTSPPPSGGGLGEKMGIPNLWSRATAAAQAAGLTGRAGLTTDAGWGCMLRTGQSVLANALIHAHLGRDWRLCGPPAPSSAFVDSEASDDTEDRRAWREARRRYALYVRMLSWFMDEPSRACPFGVHRMAREGKRLGKEVGEWFGPSTAAGAIKSLVDAFPEAGMGVCLASDGVVFLSQVRKAAADPSLAAAAGQRSWSRPVLILVGVRLGLEGVNPVYHDSIKRTFSLPQSVGIAGGRPSSSYYFVGYQGNSLFYLDPHHVRPTVPFRHPPPHVAQNSRSPNSPQDRNDGVDSTAEADEWWSHAYSPSELATFHCEKPRRMPLRSLDPSMLLGFLVTDEASLQDLVEQVRQLPKPIFAMQDAPPRWMMLDEDEEGDGMDAGDGGKEDPALESFSESSVDGFDDDDGASEQEDADVAAMGGERRDRRPAGSDSHTELEGAATPNLGGASPNLSASATLDGQAFPSSSSAVMGALGLAAVRRPQQQVGDGSLRPRIETREVSDASQRTERPGRVGEDAGPASAGDESFASVSHSDASGLGMGDDSLVSPPLSPALDDHASGSDTAWEQVERERSPASPPYADIPGRAASTMRDEHSRRSPPSSPQQPAQSPRQPSRRARKEGARPQPPAAASFPVSAPQQPGSAGLLSFPSLGASPSKDRSVSSPYVGSSASASAARDQVVSGSGKTHVPLQTSSLTSSPSMGVLGLGAPPRRGGEERWAHVRGADTERRRAPSS